MPLPLTEFTVAEAVKQKGYTTALFGKWQVHSPLNMRFKLNLIISFCRHLGDFKKLKGGNPKWPVCDVTYSLFLFQLSLSRFQIRETTVLIPGFQRKDPLRQRRSTAVASIRAYA